MLADSARSEMTAWAEILSIIGEKNSRLYELLEREPLPRSASRSPGRLVLEELERERSRIARELHAGAGQPLAGIKLNLEMLDGWATDLPVAGREALVRLQSLADQALQQVRAVSHNLHPPDWQALRIEDALWELIRSSGLGDRLEVELNIEALAEQPSHAVKVALYRCAQECLSNIARHSSATRLMMSLALMSEDAANPAIELLVEDNGPGFSQETATPGKGIGLKAMREHASDLGGSCEVSSSEHGVKIRVRFPLLAD